MQVTFLGTSSGVPTRARNVSAVALRLPQRSEMWLFDCGEGTQHQFLRSDLRLSQLRRVFITHMHGDHVFGLPGLLASLGLSGSCNAGVDLYGPDPLDAFLSGALNNSSTRIGYPLQRGDASVTYLPYYPHDPMGVLVSFTGDGYLPSQTS